VHLAEALPSRRYSGETKALCLMLYWLNCRDEYFGTAARVV